MKDEKEIRKKKRIRKEKNEKCQKLGPERESNS